MRKVEHKFRTIKVTPAGAQVQSNGSINSQEKLTTRIINKLNKCVVHLCQGRFEMARKGFDEIITNSEEHGGLGLREITLDGDVDSCLPAYLVTLLTYFYLRTKNLKMARAMVKSRRFVIDTDHLAQQARFNSQHGQPQFSGAGALTHGAVTAAAGSQKYSKKAAVMVNYKSTAKNFT